MLTPSQALTVSVWLLIPTVFLLCGRAEEEFTLRMQLEAGPHIPPSTHQPTDPLTHCSANYRRGGHEAQLPTEAEALGLSPIRPP